MSAPRKSGWASSRRRYDLPPDWEENYRLPVLREAGWVCEIGLEDRCIVEATEVDHIDRGNDHSRKNLRAACKPCHAKKSSDEGNARKRELRELRKRRTERHPGSI